MSALYQLKYNNALQQNPNVAEIDITTHGSDWLWAVFSIMASTFVGVSIFTMVKVDRGHRAFNYMICALLATASVAYFSMASDLGATPITVEFLHGNWAHSGNGYLGYPTRSIWYARYIDWTITTPLLLLTLLLITPVPTSTVFITVFMDIVMIVTGLLGSLVQSEYKWGFWVFGMMAMGWVFYELYGPGLKAVKDSGDKNLYTCYLHSTLILSFLWFLYPIAWGLADGGNVIHPDSEMVFYGILDLFAKPFYSIYHLYTLSKVDYESFHLVSGKNSIYAHPTAVGQGAAARKLHNDGRTSDVTAAESRV